jgi:DNA-binding XRE family transcriptional regulator
MLARVETPLKRLLEEEGRSQAWLARRLEVRRQTVQAWCNGIHAPSEARQREIAEILRQNVEDLFPPAVAS